MASTRCCEPGSGAHCRPVTGSEKLRARHGELHVRSIASGAVWCVSESGAVPAVLAVVDSLSGVEVNRVLAARLGAGVGAEVTLAAPRATLTPLGPMPLRRRVAVARVAESRPGEDRAEVRVPPALGAALLGGTAVADRRAARFRPVPRVQCGIGRAVRAAGRCRGDLVPRAQSSAPCRAGARTRDDRFRRGAGDRRSPPSTCCAIWHCWLRRSVPMWHCSALWAWNRERIRRLFLTLGIGVGALGGVIGTVIGWRCRDRPRRHPGAAAPARSLRRLARPVPRDRGRDRRRARSLPRRGPARFAGPGPRCLPPRCAGRAEI